MAASPQDSDVASAVNKLSLNENKKLAKATKKTSKKVIADSWEDESSDSEPEPENETAGARLDSNNDNDEEAPSKLPAPPPPTPLSPVGASWSNQSMPASRAPDGGPRRPEKTDAVARRMIAAGLGLKAPRQTEEQRAYQKSIREQEKRRREQEKLAEKKAQEEAERAKAAVWDD